MPTLRSQYQHVRNDISKSVKNNVGGGNNSSENMVASVQSCLSNHTSGKESYESPTISSMVNVSGSSGASEEEKSFIQSSSRNSVSPPGSGRKSVGNRSRRSSRNSTGSRRSSRRSSGSISEDILNTATVHTSITTNEAPLYTTSSLPTLHNQGLVYSNTFASYKHLAENAIMQSLQVPPKLSMEGLSSLYPSEENLLYLDQHLLQSHQQYIPLLMKSRADSQHLQDASTPRTLDLKNGHGILSRDSHSNKSDISSHMMSSSGRHNYRSNGSITVTSAATMGQLLTSSSLGQLAAGGMSASNSLSSLASVGSVTSSIRQHRDFQSHSRRNEFSNSLQNLNHRGMETSSSMSSLVSEPYDR